MWILELEWKALELTLFLDIDSLLLFTAFRGCCSHSVLYRFWRHSQDFLHKISHMILSWHHHCLSGQDSLAFSWPSSQSFIQDSSSSFCCPSVPLEVSCLEVSTYLHASSLLILPRGMQLGMHIPIQYHLTYYNRTYPNTFSLCVSPFESRVIFQMINHLNVSPVMMPSR